MTDASDQIPQQAKSAFKEILGERVRFAASECLLYGYDNSRREAMPGAVGFPRDHDEARKIVAVCYQHGIPLTTRGLGSGTTGAAVPVAGGMVLATERLVGIGSIDTTNRNVKVATGVTNAQLQNELERVGFFWPPDPTSAAYSTIGGNLACNAAGPHAVKYGTPRDNVLGLLAIDGRGETLRTGVITTKGVVGYDLTRLIIGSEGTLAVITEATLRIVPLPEARRFLRATYSSLPAAAAAIAKIMAQPETPSALEFMDPVAVDLVRDYAEVDLPGGTGSILLIEVDGNRLGIEQAVSAVSSAARNDGLVEIREAENADERSALWACRKALSPAMRKIAPKKINEDVVVPVTRLPELVTGLDDLQNRHAVRVVSFGHAGNGNLHVNLLGDPEKPGELDRLEACLQELFELVLRLGGTISGEHGIGMEKRRFVDLEIEPATLDLMRGIKSQFDPKGILNPGKLIPE